MNQDILDYLSTQRVCVIALEMPDGSPHASTVHFAHTNDPLTFIFETDRRYRKSEALFGKNQIRASMVVGTNEEDMKTFQLDGIAKLLEDEALKNLYLEKFPNKKEKSISPNFVFFTFTPTWWRFTDWTVPEGKKIFTSDEKM